jgi:hypothetical protein
MKIGEIVRMKSANIQFGSEKVRGSMSMKAVAGKEMAFIYICAAASGSASMSAIWNACARFLSRPRVTDWLIRRAMRTPYSPIVKDGELYMERFWLFNPYPPKNDGRKAPWQFPISIRLHHILLPDQGQHLHDHPWNARTIILRGGYAEVRPIPSNRHEALTGLPPPDGAIFIRCPGDTATLNFGEYHRITGVSPGGVWTLFITGKYRGTWGFLKDGHKVPWREYLGINK